MGARTVAGLVSLVGTIEAGAALCGFLACEITEAVVFCFGIAVGVVERWRC